MTTRYWSACPSTSTRTCPCTDTPVMSHSGEARPSGALTVAEEEWEEVAHYPHGKASLWRWDMDGDTLSFSEGVDPVGALTGLCLELATKHAETGIMDMWGARLAA